MALDSKGPTSSPDPKVYDHYKFVSQLVWLPSYVGIALLMIGVTGGTGLVVLGAILAGGAALEFIYRVAFGARRRELGIGTITFALQCVVWGGVWAWYIFR
jgi:vacuolar-type H+-ATPase subunit I/STV1